MTGKRPTRSVLHVALLLTLALTTAAVAQRLPTHETRYYMLHTDLDVDRARAAAIRMTKMAEEYYRRTRDFGGGQPQRKFDFYLFRDREDYYAAGGPPGSAGVYMRRGDPNATDPRLGEAKLMAFLIEGRDDATWHVIQHEGFHQFADVAIGNLPPWVNEGLAEYFGESIFTGDGYVSGVVRQRRLERIRLTLEERRFMNIEQMMVMTLAQWNRNLTIENYDQGWAMVHFLAHADDGKYQRPLSQFIARVGRGEDQASAWRATFGSTDGMAQALAEFWNTYDVTEADHLRAEATLRTLTSYLARATLQQKTFDDFAAFHEALRNDELSNDVQVVGENWLPADLRERVVANTDAWLAEGYTFEIISPRQLQMTPPEGDPRVATYKVKRGLVSEVQVK